ncbi:SH3 domain-binding protein 1 [Brachypodium distachyon]|uniref:SH3 domain-binding protein 1 n=1 Tax=Brachypodium distachyon TaxID=15368 RepID=UPI00071CE183|nr:SH3 domain-binding protein 1 [Brachypodium distachyon]|eukprot:XP_014757987.1 SH3 domain-binding protein 1 [Brachypodium distachyon]
MRAPHTTAPEPIPLPPPLSIPLPLPPPPLSLPSPTTAIHRRNSRNSSASSSSVSTASSSSPSQSPAPSPTRASVVPFSWERHPGVPKSSLAGLLSNSGGAPRPLPPPPPRRCRRIRRRRRLSVDDADPFTAAFVECTREEGTADADEDKLWPPPARATASAVHTARPWRLAAGGGGAAGILGFLDLYGCKTAMDVAGGAFLAPRRRTVAARPGHGRAAARR